MKALLINAQLLALLIIVGCVAQYHPALLGRWKVSGTEDVVVLLRQNNARLTSHGKTINGSFEPLAPDLLKVIFPATGPHSTERVITYKVPVDSREGRLLKVFTDTESNNAR